MRNPLVHFGLGRGLGKATATTCMALERDDKMNGALAMMLLVMGIAAETEAQRSCALEVGATETAYRLSELPQDIRDDLAKRTLIFGDEIADSDGPLLQTDAPTAAERDYPTLRFAQALRVRDRWFVQFERSMFAGVVTVSYNRHHPEGPFNLYPGHFLAGPSCVSIKAALAGVRSASPFTTRDSRTSRRP